MYIKLIFLVGVGLYFLNTTSNPETGHLIDAANLAIHEGGHVVFSFFGEYIQALGGSLLQVLMPLTFALYFFGRKENISGLVCLIWAGQSMHNVGIYAGDAIAMQLPLFGGGDEPIHDWNYLLSESKLLPYTTPISLLLKAIGWFTMFVSFSLSLYLLISEENREKGKYDRKNLSNTV